MSSIQNGQGQGDGDKIPVIDMGNLYNIEFNKDDAKIGEIAKILGEALHEYGFVYMVNHGIPEELIQNAFKESLHFFQLPPELKAKCAKASENVLKNFHGYAVPGQENLALGENKKAVWEVRENFDVIQQDRFYPTEDAPNFQPTFEALEDACRAFDWKLLKILAISLQLDDPDFFSKATTHLENRKVNNFTDLRANYYPAIPQELEGDKSAVGAVRCATHTDWDMVTLLFQDDMGGLEVKKADNQWIQAPPIPNSIVVNIGDLLEVWTGGYFPATSHRVLVPEEEVQRRSARQSIGFFLFPDDHAVVEQLTSPILPPLRPDIKATSAYENFMLKAGSAYGVEVEVN